MAGEDTAAIATVRGSVIADSLGNGWPGSAVQKLRHGNHELAVDAALFLLFTAFDELRPAI